MVSATAVADHYFSLWYFVEGYSTDWYYLWGTTDPVGGLGPISINITLEVAPGTGRLLIAATSSDYNRTCYSTSAKQLLYYNISATAVNV